jgi:hypothetical protein
VSQQQNGLARGAGRSEAEFEEITEMVMAATPDTAPKATRVSFDQCDGSINCEPVFTWGFLKDKVAQCRSNPFLFTLSALQNRSLVHGRML